VQDCAEIGKGDRRIGVVRSDAGLMEGQGLLLQCSSAIQVTLSLQNRADVSEASCGHWVARSMEGLANGQGAPVQGQGAVDVPLVGQTLPRLVGRSR
jgi:hypothetical protein